MSVVGKIDGRKYLPKPSIQNVAGFVVESMARFESEWVAGLRLESMVDFIAEYAPVSSRRYTHPNNC
ncbi:MAG: hypothetical protein ABL903_04160 [Methylococcales bacterium]